MKMQREIQTKIGKLFVVASEEALHGIFWKKQAGPFSDSQEADSLISKTETQLSEYLAGRRTSFDLPLDPQGTEFQKRVWMQLRQIPFGETWSYKTMATRLECKGASRAVGTANGKNPLNIVVPCHRVIASSGGLGGYSGGLELKEKLLRLEQTGRLE